MTERTRGHAARSHTADVVIEAWASSAEACYEEAIGAFVEIFAARAVGAGSETVAFDVGPGRPDELLVLLLEEVLLGAELRGRVPTAARVAVREDHLVGTLSLVPVEEAEVTGPVPKGISYHDLAFGRVDGTWRCRAIVDV